MLVAGHEVVLDSGWIWMDLILTRIGPIGLWRPSDQSPIARLLLSANKSRDFLFFIWHLRSCRWFKTSLKNHKQVLNRWAKLALVWVLRGIWEQICSSHTPLRIKNPVVCLYDYPHEATLGPKARPQKLPKMNRRNMIWDMHGGKQKHLFFSHNRHIFS